MEGPPRKFYYVSAIDGAGKSAKKFLIAGPYTSHADAAAKVDQVRDAADKIDGRAWFMAWGTAGSDAEHLTPMGAV